MASPLTIFRKHQRTLLAIACVLLMLVFTVGGLVSQFLESRSGRGGGTNSVAVSWKGGQLLESDLQNLRLERQQLMEFQAAVARRAIEKNGQPQSMVVPYITSEESVVESLMLAKEAENLGITIGQEAVKHHLVQQLGDGLVKSSEMKELLNSSTNGSLTELQLMDGFRRELMAYQMRVLANGGGFSGNWPVPPTAAFDYFQRLYKKMEAEVLPIPVSEFIAQVSDTPTDAEITELYDKYKDRFPVSYLPEPGFKRPKKAAFQWLKADFQKFLDREVANVPEADIQEYYEKNKDNYRKLSAPSDLGPSSTGPNETPASETPASETPTQTPEPPGPAPSSPPSGDDLPESSGPLEAPTESVEADYQGIGEETKDPASPAPAEPSGDSKPASEPANTPEVSPVGEASSPSATDSSAVDPTSSESTAPPSSDDVGPSDANGEGKTDPTAESNPIDAATTTLPGTGVLAETIEYQPLADVRDSIARQLARQKANDAVKQAVNQIVAELSQYFNARIRWQARGGGDAASEPKRPDLKQLADAHGLTFGDIPLVNAIEVEAYDLGQAYDLDFSTGSIQRLSFAAQGFDKSLSLFQPKVIGAEEQSIDSKYVYWKVAQEDEYVPTKEQAKDDIVRYWKLKKAIPLAKAKGEELAKRVRESGGSLRSAFANDPTADKVTDTGEFTWMTFGAMVSGQGEPRMSSVEGVQYPPGNQFMKDVFALEPGQTAVTMNYAENEIYVVYLKAVTFSQEGLRELFLKEGLTQPVVVMARREQMVAASTWFQDLESRWELKWHRPSQE